MAEAAFDTAVDTEKIEQFSIDMADYATTIKGDIDAIYSKVNDEMSKYWVGDSFNNFKSQVDAFRPTLDTLVDMINAFSKYFKEHVGPEATTLDSKIKDILSQFGTGAGGGGR